MLLYSGNFWIAFAISAWFALPITIYLISGKFKNLRIQATVRATALAFFFCPSFAAGTCATFIAPASLVLILGIRAYFSPSHYDGVLVYALVLGLAPIILSTAFLYRFFRRRRRLAA